MREILLGLALAVLGCSSSTGASPDASHSPMDATSTMDVTSADSPGSDVQAVDEDSGPVGHVALWELPRTPESDFSLPWPNDIARTSTGNIDLTFVPNGDNNAFVNTYIQDFTGALDGFSPVGAVYFRFTVDVATSSLPATAAASVGPTSSVQIINIDPTSPDHLQYTPVQWYFRSVSTAYWPAETLAIAPVAGFPLRPHTRYAVVITNAVTAADGSSFTRDQDLINVLAATSPSGADAALTSARTLYATALPELTAAGVSTSQILSLAVFTTQDPGDAYFRGADWLLASGPTPGIVDLTAPSVSSTYTVLRGHYGPSPVFQAGVSPYLTPGSGDFVLDSTGTPQVQGTIDIHFSLSLPPGPMPAAGWPVAIYAHGTGGDADSFLDDGTGAAAAAQHVAMFGFDQIFNGERSDPTVDADVAFFNFSNPHAGRTNNRQAALDLVQAGRFIRRMTFPLTNADGSVTMVHFDTNHVMFFGHSQGGLNGPLWLAAEDGANAAVLSGSAGELVLSLMLKTQPDNIPELLSAVLDSEAGELNVLHPVLTLAQTIADPSDPVNYGRYIVHEPRAGMHPKSIFQTQGFIDHYAPPPTIAALALSIGLPLAGTVVVPQPAYSLSGLPVESLPLYNNLNGITGAWMQFIAPPGDDGHFVVFDVPAARLRAAAFLGSSATNPQGIATVVATVPSS